MLSTNTPHPRLRTAANVRKAAKRDDPEGFAAVEPFFTDANWKILAEISELIANQHFLDDFSVLVNCRNVLDTKPAPDVATWLRKGCQVILALGQIDNLVIQDWEGETFVSRVELAPMIGDLKRASYYAEFLSKFESDDRIKAAIAATPNQMVAPVSAEFEYAYRLALYSQSVLDSLPGEAITALLPQHGLGEQLEAIDWERDFLLYCYMRDYGTALDDNAAREYPLVDEWFESWNQWWDYAAVSRRLHVDHSLNFIEKYLKWLDRAAAAWDPANADNVRALALLTAAESRLTRTPAQETVYGWLASKCTDLARILGQTPTVASRPPSLHSTEVDWKDELCLWLESGMDRWYSGAVVTVDGECDHLKRAERNSRGVLIHLTSGHSIQLAEQTHRETTAWQGHDDKGRSVFIRQLMRGASGAEQLCDLHG